MCSALSASAFCWSNRAGLELTSTTSNAATISSRLNRSRSSRDRPAEQRKVIQQSLGDEAPLAMGEQIRLRVALRQLLGALPQYRWKVGEFRNALGDPDPDQRLIQRELPRRRRQQVFAAEHVGDLHQRVVDRVDQGVQRVSGCAGQREIGNRARREGGGPAHQIIPAEVFVGHPQPHHRVTALGEVRRALRVGQRTVEVVVAELGVAAGGHVTRLDLLRRRKGIVGLARREQRSHHVAVDLAALRLPVRAIGSADLGPLVPIETEPAQRVEQRQIAFLGVALGVGVLDAEHEGAAGVPGVGPVEQRGADHPDVGGAGGRRAESRP